MTLCLATPALAMALAWPAFTLSWTHSVEQVEWRERWRLEAGQLVLEEARVRGSGAGMEPPDGSVLDGGWWVYRAERRVPVLRLAVSGATGAGWQICGPIGSDAPCRDLEAWLSRGDQPPPAIEIRPGPACDPIAR